MDFGSLLNKAKQAMQSAAQKVGSAVNKIAQAAQKAGKAVASAAKKAANAIKSAAKAAGKAIAKIVAAAKKAGQAFSREVKKAVVACGKKIQKVARHVSASLVFPGQQHYNNCGVQSAAQIIAQSKGYGPSEKRILTKAIDKGRADSGGITAPVGDQEIPEAAGGTDYNSRQEILKDYGVPSSTAEYSRESLAKAIKDRKGIIASIHTDGASWWKNKDGTSRGSGKHALVVTDGDFDADGNLTDVYINDTGVGERHKVSITDFENAVDAHDDPHLNITDKPIWP